MKINIYTSHPSAFISSTFQDLKQERNAVANVLRESNLNINALDVKPASDNSSRKEIMNGIKESDFLILIVGERYGSIIPRMTTSNKLSITRWEYLKAIKNFGKYVLVYFKKVESKDSMYYDDPSSGDYKIKRRSLEEFKKELSNAHNPKYFITAEELAEGVRKAIIPTYRSGVKSLLIKNQSLLKEIESLKQNSQLFKNSTEPVKENSQVGLFSSGLTEKRQKGLLSGLAEDTNTSKNISLGLLGHLTNKETKK